MGREGSEWRVEVSEFLPFDDGVEVVSRGEHAGLRRAAVCGVLWIELPEVKASGE